MYGIPRSFAVSGCFCFVGTMVTAYDRHIVGAKWHGVAVWVQRSCLNSIAVG
jgi:hypothetical protein